MTGWREDIAIHSRAMHHASLPRYFGRRQDIVVHAHRARFNGRSFCCSVGRGGIAGSKREGDGKTPAGNFGLLDVMYRPDRVDAASLAGAVPLAPGDIWSDDPQDPAYNQPLNVIGHYPFSHERLYRPDPVYDLIVPTDFNWPNAVAGKGSAVFLHVWRKPRHPTEGCVAFALADLLWIVARIEPATRLIIRE